MNILIVGANFGNKGAQSMLFTCYNEFCKRFDNCTVYFGTWSYIPKISDYKFEYVRLSRISFGIAIYNSFTGRVMGLAKGIVKKLIGRDTELFEEYKLRKIAKKIDLIVDVSGFALSSTWGIDLPTEYFDNFDYAMKYDIPIVLLPQSFGPFDYKENQAIMDEKIDKYLNYASMIFAREKDGRAALENQYGLAKARYCPDTVLIGSFPQDYQVVYKKKMEENVPKLEGNNWVGLIPNMRLFDHEDKERILSFYDRIIQEVLTKGKKICIFRHSEEDIVACRWIMERNRDKQDILLIENGFSCFEYDKFCRQFCYMISSRYHSVVHAYRNGIPCVMIAWAQKYYGIADLFEQTDCIFNLYSLQQEKSRISEIVSKMDSDYMEIGKKIFRVLEKINGSSNCFDLLETWYQEKF